MAKSVTLTVLKVMIKIGIKWPGCFPMQVAERKLFLKSNTKLMVMSFIEERKFDMHDQVAHVALEILMLNVWQRDCKVSPVGTKAFQNSYSSSIGGIRTQIVMATKRKQTQ